MIWQSARYCHAARDCFHPAEPVLYRYVVSIFNGNASALAVYPWMSHYPSKNLINLKRNFNVQNPPPSQITLGLTNEQSRSPRCKIPITAPSPHSSSLSMRRLTHANEREKFSFLPPTPSQWGTYFLSFLPLLSPCLTSFVYLIMNRIHIDELKLLRRFSNCFGHLQSN